VNVVNT